MKPKTKLQKRVVELHHKNRKAHPQIEEWAIKKSMKFVQKKKETCVCAECRYEFSYKQSDFHRGRITCPMCNKKLRSFEGKTRSARQTFYYSQITVIEEFQVIRIWEFDKYSKSYSYPGIHTRELFQHWIHPSGQHEIMSVNIGGFGYGFSHGIEMEIRHDHDRYYPSSYVYPEKKILPIVKRNGYKHVSGFSDAWLMHALLAYNKAETLFKAGQYYLCAAMESSYKRERIEKYWPQIRICMRNNFIVKNPSDWFDHLRLIQDEFDLDIYNPKYICPKDFKKVKQHYIDKRNKRVRERQKIEQEKAYLKDNNKYIRDKSRFFDIVISKGDLTITPLKSLDEFREEAQALHHCVFSPTYYNDKNSLILSAKKKGERLETIEFNLKGLNVEQSRGLENKPTRYSKRILELMNENVKLIKEKI